jgi:hypothetical protein
LANSWGEIMKRLSLAVPVLFAFLVAGGCSKKQPETAQNQPPAAQATPANPASGPQAAASPDGVTTPQAAMPNDLPAYVTLTDGSKYKGTLVSKEGSQLTFRGDNGATRTFDSRDIKSIKFGDDTPAPASASTQKRKSRPVESGSAPAPAPAQTAGNNTSAPAAEPAPPPPPREIVIPSGTQVSVRTNESIDSKTASAGQTFSAVISQSVVDDSGEVAIPRGSPATLVIREAAAGKVKANELVLDLRSVSVGGHDYRVESNSITQKGKSNVGANKRTAIFTGGGSALGAVIGAIAGGGKGAAIGAAAGAGAGAGTQILTRGSVKVPAETVLTFRLQAPLQLQAQ